MVTVSTYHIHTYEDADRKDSRYEPVLPHLEVEGYEVRGTTFLALLVCTYCSTRVQRDAKILYWCNISILHYFVLLATHCSSNIWGNIRIHKCYGISSLPLHT